jgi:hypothetical protein
VPTHATGRARCRKARNQGVPETLMIPLAGIILDEFGDGAPKMGLADGNQPAMGFCGWLGTSGRCWLQRKAELSRQRMRSVMLVAGAGFEPDARSVDRQFGHDAGSNPRARNRQYLEFCSCEPSGCPSKAREITSLSLNIRTAPPRMQCR